MKTKKLLSVIITLAMVVSLLPMTVSVSAEETDNQYVVRSWNGKRVTEELVDIPTATTLTNDKTIWSDGWYVADGEIDLDTVDVSGNANLILKDGCYLSVKGSINVVSGYSMTIYAQKGGTGKLTVKNGIGSGNRTSSGDITIHGGNVMTEGNEARPAIGCGDRASMGTFILYGGNVTAMGAGIAPAIGHYSATSTGTVNLYGGNLTVTAENARAIKAASITIGEKVKVTDGSGNAVTLNNTWAQTLTGSSYTFLYTAQPVVEYQYYDEAQQKFFTGECDEYTVVTSDTTEWTGGWYVVNEDVTIDGNVYFSGNVNLILTDGKTLTVDGDITGSSTFSVYAQTDKIETGNLTVGTVLNEGLIYFHGGNITAEKDDKVSTCLETNSSMYLYGGTVTTSGGAYGIFVDDLIIYDGNVTVRSDNCGIYTEDFMAMKKGTVTVTSNVTGIRCRNHMDVINGTVIVTGGDCGIKCGINSTDLLYLNGGDITVKSGKDGKAVLVEGKIHVGDSMAVYNQANERIENPDWHGTYYRFKTAAVPYLYYDEVNKELKQADCIDYEVIDTDHIPNEWKDGKWYAVKSDVVISHSVLISGEVHLILTDESTLKIQTNESPLYVNGTISGKNAHLYLHSQSTGSKAGKLNCYGPNGPDKSKGGNAITVSALTIDGTPVSANGGNGGLGNSLKGGNAIEVSILTVNGATVTAVGGVGGRGLSGGGSWGAAHRGGDGGSGIKCLSLVMNEGSVYATGGVGGSGGKEPEGYLPSGAVGASVTLNEGGVIDGAVTVKANEADEFIPLPSGESISDYQFAKITAHSDDPKSGYIVAPAEAPEGVTMTNGVQSLKDTETDTFDMRFFWNIDFNGNEAPTKLGAYFFDWEQFNPESPSDSYTKIENSAIDETLTDGGIFFGTITGITDANKTYYAIPLVNDNPFAVCMLNGTAFNTNILTNEK